MYQNVLVISDNLEMARFFKDLVDLNKDYAGFKFTLSISPNSNKSKFVEALKSKVFVYNLRDKSDIETIISRYDLVLSIHCKQLFPEKMVNSVKCINVHPGYNPINRGWYPQVFAIMNDLPIGATIHEIDDELDHGLIIAREFVTNEITDTSLSLYNKILEKEKKLIKDNLLNILNNSYSTITPENDGHIYLKKDFNELCKIDLNEEGTFKLFYDKLRALTHGDYKNAFFINERSGKKVFISINIHEES